MTARASLLCPVDLRWAYPPLLGSLPEAGDVDEDSAPGAEVGLAVVIHHPCHWEEEQALLQVTSTAKPRFYLC